MFYLKPFNQAYLVPLLCQPDTEFDIFDGRIRIPGRIKSASRHKSSLADRTTSCPKGNSVGVRTLVDVVVQQVFERRAKISARWIVVIGAEQGGQLRIVLEFLGDNADRIGAGYYVRVEEHQNIPCCMQCAKVSGRPRPPSSWRTHIKCIISFNYIANIFHRTIINYDQFSVSVAVPQRLETLLEFRRAIVDTHDH
jgi:hypothetical protein